MAILRHHALTRYQQRLGSLPPSGGGGCHPALLGCATLGVRAGVRPDQICEDLRRHVRGTRNVTDREIGEAVGKAMNGRVDTVRGPRQQWRRPPRATRPAFDAAAFLADRLAEAEGIGEVDIWEASPIRIDTSPDGDTALLLETLYGADDVLFMGGTYGRTVKRVGEWLACFRAGRPVPPHVIPNPLTGEVGQTVETAEAWTELVEERLFRRYLIPLGCDAACRNEARLSRLPGHFRTEKGRWQRLLYLAPEGRAIHAGA